MATAVACASFFHDACLGRVFSVVQHEIRRRGLELAGDLSLGVVFSMNVSNSKKSPSTHDGFVWAGAAARMRRGGRTLRSGRRSALLSVLTSYYANTSRGTRPAPAADTRSSTERA